MRFNTQGDAAYGAGQVAVNGSVPAALVGVPAGALYGPAWRTATTLVFQNNAGASLTQQYDTVSHALTTLDSQGLNQCAAGHGAWATWLAGRGVKTNLGALGSIPDVTFGDVGTDTGELALWTSPQTGRGVRAYNATGTTVLFEDADVLIVGTVMRVRSSWFSYQASTGWVLVNLTGGSSAFAPRTGESIGWITPLVTAAGVPYVLEASTRLTLREAATAHGWEVSPPAFTNYPDLVEVSPGVVRIGWCANTGETPDSLHLTDLTLATGATQTGTVVAGAIVWTPGPTLVRQDFAVGPVQDVRTGGGGVTGNLAPPLRHPVVDAATGDRVTRPWAMFFQQQATGLGGAQRAIAATPPPIPQAPGFGIVVGPPVPLVALRPSDLLTLTSADGSVAFTSDPATNTLDLSATGGGGTSHHYDCPLSDGDPVAADLIFASGECIIVQVPV